MALYGFDFYAGARYGAPIILEFAARGFEAESREYGDVFLSWNNPTGEWTKFRLIRNAYGIPVDQDDGVVLLDTANPPTSYTDRDLPEGRFQYYRVFVHSDLDDLWHSAAEAIILVLKDHGNTEKLYSLIPEAFRKRDRKVRFSDKNGLLYNLLSVIGLGFDHLQGEYESLTWLSDPDRISGGLLPTMGQQYGVEWEPELGMRQMRQYLRNVIHLYKLKGTRLGIEGAATALTGWAADAWWDDVVPEVAIELQADRVNFVTNPSFEADASGWTITNGSIAQVATEAFSGGNSGEITAAAAGDVTAAHLVTDIVGNETYVFSAHAKPATDVRNVEVSIDWQDAGGVSLGTTAWQTVTEEMGAWVRPSIVAASPANTVQAELRVRIVGATAAGEIHYLDAVLVERGVSVLTYFDGSNEPLGDNLWEGTAHLSRSHYYRHRPLKNQRLDQLISKFTPIGVDHRLVYALEP